MNFDVYCDESRPDLFASTKSSARYLVIGSLWLPSDARAALKEELHGLRVRHRVGGEFKWSKVSPSRLNFYRDLVGWFFDHGPSLRFRCIAVDRSQVNLGLFHAGDQELGFYKFYYQLLHHWILDFNTYSFFLDFKRNRRRDRLHVLQQCLANANLSSRITAVQPVRSEEAVLIQAADVLTGAVARQLNVIGEGSPAKAEVVRAIEQRLGRPIGPTPLAERKLNVFVINLRGGW